MLARDNAAVEPPPHRFQIVLQHSPVGVFQKIYSLIRSACEHRAERGFQHCNYDTMTIFTTAAWGIAKNPAECFPETAVRLETAVENSVIQTSALPDPHKCTGQPVAAAPGGEAHTVMLLKPSPGAFRGDTEIAQFCRLETCVRRSFHTRNQFLGPFRWLAIGLQWMTAFAGPIACE